MAMKSFAVYTAICWAAADPPGPACNKFVGGPALTSARDVDTSMVWAFADPPLPCNKFVGRPALTSARDVGTSMVLATADPPGPMLLEDKQADTRVNGEGDPLQSKLEIAGGNDVAKGMDKGEAGLNVPEGNHTENPRPTGLYEPGQKELRQRIYECPTCGDPVDGIIHQCGVCFVHIHFFCSEPYPGTEEGYGQVRLCHECSIEGNDKTEGSPLQSATETSLKAPRSDSDMDAEERARQNEDRQGIIRGNYPVQDIFKTFDYLQAHGLGRSYLDGKPLPAVLPTFYVDCEPKKHALVNAKGGKRERRALRKAAEKEAMLAWQSADSSRQFESKKALRKSYRRVVKAPKLRTMNLDDENADASDDSTVEGTGEKKLTMQAAHILDALSTGKRLNNKHVTTLSAPKTKQKKKKKQPVTASLMGDTGMSPLLPPAGSSQKCPFAQSEVPSSKKAKKTFTEELLKEVS